MRPPACASLTLKDSNPALPALAACPHSTDAGSGLVQARRPATHRAPDQHDAPPSPQLGHRPTRLRSSRRDDRLNSPATMVAVVRATPRARPDSAAPRHSAPRASTTPRRSRRSPRPPPRRLTRIEERSVKQLPEPLSPSSRSHRRPGPGAASRNCHPPTGATVSSMNRDCTLANPAANQESNQEICLVEAESAGLDGTQATRNPS